MHNLIGFSQLTLFASGDRYAADMLLRSEDMLRACLSDFLVRLGWRTVAFPVREVFIQQVLLTRATPAVMEEYFENFADHGVDTVFSLDG